MKILQVKNTNLYDVFLGEGWYNHARVYFKDNKVSFVGRNNIRLTHPQLVTLQLKLIVMKDKHHG